MEEAFGTVLVIVVALAAVAAVAGLIGSGRAYEEIGRGGLSLRDGSDRPAGSDRPHSVSAAGPSALTAGEREAEIRQMLTARSERRVRRGEAPLDVDAELAALARPPVDPALRAEVRQLVVARNERRARRGEAPLDVDAEVERQLRGRAQSM